MLFFKPHSYLGIDFGAGGVKLVELRREKKRPVLFTYAYTSEPQDIHHLHPAQDRLKNTALAGVALPTAAPEPAPDLLAASSKKISEYASTIRQACQAARTVSKIAVVSLPVSAVFHTVVTLPPTKKEEFDHILKAEIKKLLPYKLEDTMLDYEHLPSSPDSKAQRVLVNAVPRELVSFYSKVFAEAKLKLQALEPESAALTRSLVGRDTALTLLIDIGAERTNFFIIDAGVPMTHHSIEFGGERVNTLLQSILGVEAAIVEQIKRDLFESIMLPNRPAAARQILPREKFLPLVAGLLDPITKEIQYGLELYLRQSGNQSKRPEKIVLTGGAALFPYLSQHLADTFRMKCYVGDPWGRIVYQDKLKPLLHDIGPRMAVAIGLALRNMV